MGLLSFLKRGSAADAAEPAPKPRASRNTRGGGGADTVEDVQQLRIQARRRLIGAAVLVGVAVIVFPLIFETQPRPIPVDLPIDIPRRESATPLAIPAPAVRTAQAPAEQAPGRGVITESAEQSATDRPVPPPEAPPERPAQAPVERVIEKPAEKPVERAVERPVDKPVERKPEARPEARPEPKPKPPETRNESARVQAMLEGRPGEKKPEAAVAGGRFIVQVGAYADGKAAQDVRAKVERLGLKTYTQAVDTADGKRIRVRVGPFASREEADKAAAKVRGGGLGSNVLTL